MTRQQMYKGYASLLRNWEWEWFATLTFPRDDRRYHDNEAMRELLKWVIPLQTREKIQVGFYSVLCRKYDDIHFHLLMLGLSSSTQKRLSEVSCSRWVQEWSRGEAGANRIAMIEPVKSVRDVANYLARHVFYRKCDQFSFDFYNLKLLHRLRYFDCP